MVKGEERTGEAGQELQDGALGAGQLVDMLSCSRLVDLVNDPDEQPGEVVEVGRVGGVSRLNKVEKVEGECEIERFKENKQDQLRRKRKRGESGNILKKRGKPSTKVFPLSDFYQLMRLEFNLIFLLFIVRK